MNMFAGVRGWSALASVALLAFLQGCVALAPSHNPPVAAMPASPEDFLSRAAAQPGLGPQESAFRPLALSTYALDARLALIARAQRSIDVQYYLLQSDGVGRHFLRALRKAALRGVRVRVLVDDLYTADTQELLADFEATPNVEVRLFNPFPAGRRLDATRWGLSLLDISRLNRRMHNKLLVADGVLAVVGGRNMADEYFLQHASGNFADFDLLLTGAAVPELAAGFDAYWNSPRVHALARLLPSDEPPAVRQARFDAATARSHDTLPPLPATAQDLLGYGPVSAALMHPPMKMLRGTVQVLVDDPEKAAGRAEDGDDPHTVTQQTLTAILRTQRELLLVSPYFVPGERGMAAIREGRRKGVAITLVTNSLAATDESFVSAAFARYRPMLLREGVQVVEISPKVLDREAAAHRPGGSSAGRMHVKGFVIDRRITFVGSMNMDFRSSRLNTEVGLLVDSPALAEDVIRLIDTLRRLGSYQLRLSTDDQHVQWVETHDGQAQVYDDEPGVDLATRLKIFFFSRLISEKLL
ncbi:phospholipase D-like domain-containing protein [Pseudacidovorax intermedius]|uniref:phospholipase D-like domain-containing protein n=1 Tax=Pseudacidovorax intermedius TaxID=433924 RepID=UPI000345B1A3|nr:phospholipase D family protein [Pseudacidovorax intermedius]